MYETKDLSAPVMDVTARRVKVAVSEVGSVDLDNEIIEAGAYTKTIAERGPGSANLIWHLTDHYPTLAKAVGKPSEIGMEGNKLFYVTDIAATNWGNDVLEMYKSGLINQHSVGFSTVRDEKLDNQPRLIKELKLYEASAVLWGANPNTPTMSVGKSGVLTDPQQEFDSVFNELKSFEKAARGKFTDETCELFELRIKMLSERLKNIFAILTKQTTQAAAPALAPVNEEKQFAEYLYLSSLKF